jgi:hypothetical protein
MTLNVQVRLHDIPKDLMEVDDRLRKPLLTQAEGKLRNQKNTEEQKAYPEIDEPEDADKIRRPHRDTSLRAAKGHYRGLIAGLKDLGCWGVLQNSYHSTSSVLIGKAP